MSIAQFDALRSLAFGGISGSYAVVGIPLTVKGRIVKFINNTQGDVVFSTNGSTDMIFVPAGTFTLYDIQTNHRVANESEYVIPIGTQFYVKQITAPVSGAVYIEIVY